jgi:hypothetical protein
MLNNLETEKVENYTTVKYYLFLKAKLVFSKRKRSNNSAGSAVVLFKLL